MKGQAPSSRILERHDRHEPDAGQQLAEYARAQARRVCAQPLRLQVADLSRVAEIQDGITGGFVSVPLEFCACGCGDRA